MKKSIGTVCKVCGALFGFCTICYAGMAVGIGYGLTSNKDEWSMVTTNAEAATDLVETHNVTRWLLHMGELAGMINAKKLN